MKPSSPTSTQALLFRLLLLRTLVVTVAVAPAIYVDIQLLDVDASHLGFVLGVVTPIVIGGLALVVPIGAVGALLRHAMEAEASPAERLGRLLRLPGVLTFVEAQSGWFLGGIFFNGAIGLALDRPPRVILVGVAVAMSAGLFSAPIMYMLYEKALAPVTLEAFRRAPHERPAGEGLFLPRQSWFLPAIVVSALLITCITSIATLQLRLEKNLSSLADDLELSGEYRGAARVRARIQPLQRDLTLPVAFLGGFAAMGAIFTAAWAARRLAQGARAVGASLDALVEGRASPPQWVSTDELGDLSARTWLLYEQLQELPRALSSSAGHLAEAGTRLTEASDQQNRTLSRQASAIHQARTTAQEIQQMSKLAASRAGSVLQVAERAAAMGKLGEESLAGTEQGLDDIRGLTHGLNQQVVDLGTRAREVGRVSEVVKSLADQSHMLAINAAIEASRAGEQGRGFAVVARQMRELADQSIKATGQVRGLLEGMEAATGEAVTTADKSSQGVEAALVPLRKSGERLRELIKLTHESAAAVRQIAEAVAQQHAGVDQLFSAVSEMDELMAATLRQLGTTQEAATAVAQATGQVSELAERYVS
ncbi:methyl-accepting chemotaxis protein [Corallococcus sp. AB049A]|uniref:methyl-accepting chemotaxis protein n=1 Tax=Corallococcus sp. AB049A TaxID=2316721 RepID=UPI000EDE06B4|nr:methyl-accepting chemotaxis protein [Corallococcus sp. AB049A]RKI62451.1 methyl-accepting chemotaxis protein [Corallococcus sp. AB049A]